MKTYRGKQYAYVHSYTYDDDVYGHAKLQQIKEEHHQKFNDYDMIFYTRKIHNKNINKSFIRLNIFMNP